MKNKRIRIGILIVVLIGVIAGAAYNFRGRFVSTTDSVSYKPETQKVLIAYFSHADVVGVDVVSAASLVKSNGESKGNTEIIADTIAENINADVFKIVTEEAYPSDYNSTVDLAKKEQNEDARPALKNKIDNIKDYDIIMLGYPNWWGTMPMAVKTFIEEYDLSGKTIIPFCTHEGSGLGNSVLDLKNECPGSNIVKGLAIRGGSVSSDSAKNDVSEWLKEIGMK